MGNSFTSLVPARCLLARSSFVHSLVRLWWCCGPLLTTVLHGCSSHFEWEVLDCGSTPGNGSFLSHPSGHAWPAPWRFFFGARRLGCAVIATSVGAGRRNRAAFVAELLEIRHPRTLDLASLGVKAITRAGHRSPSLLQ